MDQENFPKPEKEPLSQVEILGEVGLESPEKAEEKNKRAQDWFGIDDFKLLEKLLAGDVKMVPPHWTSEEISAALREALER